MLGHVSRLCRAYRPQPLPSLENDLRVKGLARFIETEPKQRQEWCSVHERHNCEGVQFARTPLVGGRPKEVIYGVNLKQTSSYAALSSK